jgi:hypothetical protein
MAAGVNLMLNPMSWCWLHISVSPNRGEFLEQNGAGSGISCICRCPAGKKYSAAIRYFTSKHIVVSDKKISFLFIWYSKKSFLALYVTISRIFYLPAVGAR